MGHVEKVDRTLPLNQMIFYARRDAAVGAMQDSSRPAAEPHQEPDHPEVGS